MRTLAGLSLGMVLLLFVAPGCGPRLSEDDLGTVIYDLEQVPGADKPFLLPDGPPKAAAERETSTADAHPNAAAESTASENKSPPADDPESTVESTSEDETPP